jgi:glycolate oxidase FAD binding subunit
MRQVLRPTTSREVEHIIRDAATAGRTLELKGRGSRRPLGRACACDAILDLGAFSGITTFEPEELVLTCGPATPIAEIETILAARNQHMAFEPPELGPLWGLPSGQGSLGGVLSTGLGGSRRITAGAPRDHFLGFKAVNGHGEAFAAGGRVVKNVTGYDLPKLMSGAFGTLAALTEVTIKVLPRAEAVQTVAFMGLSETTGLRALIDALGGSFQVTGAAFLPDGLGDDDRTATLLRLESIAETVAAATSELRQTIAPSGVETRLIDAARSASLWKDISGGAFFKGSGAPVWRLSIPPGSAAAVGRSLRRAGVGRHYYDWGGGAVWVEGSFGIDLGAAAIRRVIRTVAGHGHATLMRAPPGMDEDVDPFEPMAPTLWALTRRVKAQFDPGGILNPGRMYRDI